MHKSLVGRDAINVENHCSRVSIYYLNCSEVKNVTRFSREELQRLMECVSLGVVHRERIRRIRASNFRRSELI
jgi:hypothetical protein